ncbi:MAG: hypothetical protein IJY04_07480, partial [Clostridia bacterium]|nr:hypothetical protein [Clostridia bacterium]
MLTLKIMDTKGEVLFERKGMNIEATYEGVLEPGYKIRVSLNSCEFIAVKLYPTLAESIVWVPNKSFDFIVPDAAQRRACYAPGAFAGETHPMTVREPEDDEIYAYRQISLNSHDRHGNMRFYPHASANFVTREEPCFYERNAIDGVVNNQGHGAYPYHSWAGGARNDLEWWLDFGRDVEIDKLVFFLRADFKHDQNGVPHDSYWKSIDIEFSDGEIIHGEFTLDGSDLNPKNSEGVAIEFEKKVTRTIHLFNFTQVTEKLSFAALTQLQAFGTYIKEDLSKMEVRQAANSKDVKHYTTDRLREEFHFANLFTKDNIRM